VEGDEPVAVRPDHREAERGGGIRELGLQRGAARLGEAGREDDEPAAPAAPGGAGHFGHPGRGNRDDDRVDRLQEILQRRDARVPVDFPSRGMHAPDRPGEAERGEVTQRRVTVRAGPVARADDGHRARPQER